MSKFVKREDVKIQQERKIVSVKVPFDVNENFPNVDTSYDLPLLDVSVSKDFSFKDSLMEQDFLQNPNIVDKKEFSRIKNSKLELNDKFDNLNDPFFDLDEKRSVTSAAIRSKSKTLGKVKSRLRGNNSLTKKTSSKYGSNK
jgi:hypothetical protein